MNKHNSYINQTKSENSPCSSNNTHINSNTILNATINQEYKYLLEHIPSAKDYNETYYIIIKNIVTTAVSFVPQIGSILSGISSMYYDSIGPSLKPSEIWKSIREYAENLVNEKISDADYNRLFTTLKGLANSLKEYKVHFDAHYNSSTKIDSGEIVYEKFSNVSSLFDKHISDFQMEGKEIVSLPLFAQAAQLHLLLLRDVAVYGKEWGVPDNQLNVYKNSLKEKIQIYTMYCRFWYKDGLAKRKKNIPTNPPYPPGYEIPSNNDDYYYAKSSIQWNYVNDYVRIMTHAVLNFVSLFPFCDPDFYPLNTSLQQSRKVYTQLAGWAYPPSLTFEDINKKVYSGCGSNDRPGNYQGDLETLDIHAYDRIDAVKNSFERGDGKYSCTPVGGSGGILHQISTYKMNPINEVSGYSQIVPWALNFGYTDGKKKSMGTYDDPRVKPFCYKYPLQKLSEVKGLGLNPTGGFYGLDAVTFGFEAENLTHKHILSTNSVNIISAELYSQQSNCSSQEEFINGQNAILLNDNQSSLTYTIYVPTPGMYALDFRISIENATTLNPAKIEIAEFSNNQFDKVDFKEYLNTSDREDSVAGEYGDYSKLEGTKLMLSRGKNTIRISNLTDVEVCIDTIIITPLKLSIITMDFIDQYYELEDLANGQKNIVFRAYPQYPGKKLEWPLTLYADGNPKLNFKENQSLEEVTNLINKQNITEKSVVLSYGLPVEIINLPTNTKKLLSFKRLDFDNIYAYTDEPNAKIGNNDNKIIYIYIDGKCVYSFAETTELKIVTKAFNYLGARGNNLRIQDSLKITFDILQDRTLGLFDIWNPNDLNLATTDFDIREIEYELENLKDSDNIPEEKIEALKNKLNYARSIINGDKMIIKNSDSSLNLGIAISHQKQQFTTLDLTSLTLRNEIMKQIDLYFSFTLIDAKTGNEKFALSFQTNSELQNFLTALRKFHFEYDDIIMIKHKNAYIDVYDNNDLLDFNDSITHYFLIKPNGFIKIFNIKNWETTAYYIDGVTFSQVPQGKKIKYKVKLNGNDIGTASPYQTDGKGNDTVLFTQDFYDMEGWGVSKHDNHIIVFAIDPDTGLEYEIAHHEPQRTRDGDIDIPEKYLHHNVQINFYHSTCNIYVNKKK
ncbi:TPA: insecticidal delta-endotoxin Cry8Ea1 family protein [Bacillus cereus]